MYAHKDSFSTPSCDISTGSLTLLAPEGGDFMELILLYWRYTSVIAKDVGRRNCTLIYDRFLEGTVNDSETSDQGCQRQNAQAQYYKSTLLRFFFIRLMRSVITSSCHLKTQRYISCCYFIVSLVMARLPSRELYRTGNLHPPGIDSTFSLSNSSCWIS